MIDNMEVVADASGKLDEIYYLVKKHYSKKAKTSQRTIDVLEMANLYIELPKRYASLRDLIDAIDSFL